MSATPLEAYLLFGSVAGTRGAALLGAAVIPSRTCATASWQRGIQSFD